MQHSILLQNSLQIRKAALWPCIKIEKQGERFGVLKFYPFPCIEVKIDRYLRYRTSYRKFVSMWCKKVFCNVSKSVTSSISPFKFIYTYRAPRNITLYCLHIVISKSHIAYFTVRDIIYEPNVGRNFIRSRQFLEWVNISDSASVFHEFI